MQLNTFGRVHLSGSEFSRPKPLLLLTYLTLEGPQSRRSLAELFWPAKAIDKKNAQKQLAKLSVVLAQVKKEASPDVFPNKPGMDPIISQLECDAGLFLQAFEQREFSQALTLYQGPFLDKLAKSLDKLDISSQLYDWVIETRERFAQKARSAMIELANVTKDPKEKRRWAEKAYALSEAPEAEPSELSFLNQLLLESKSPVAQSLESAVSTSFNELSEQSLRVFLALALQDESNTTIVRTALNMSLSEMAIACEDLLLAGLIDAERRVLAIDLAENWLKERPSERIPLLLALARATPPEQAFKLYARVYEETKSFGGLGDLPRARAAYCVKTKELMNELDFVKATQLLAQVRSAEQVFEAKPSLEARFLEAYALERTGKFKDALGLLEIFTEETPDITALRATLLWRMGKREKAKALAETAAKSGVEWLWAKATANNTLGFVAHSEGSFLSAASYFKKAASLYQMANEKHRWVGSLNNYAIALDRLAQDHATSDKDKIEAMRQDAEKAYQHALEVLETIGGNPMLQARILQNLGVLWERRQEWQQAESYYVKAIEHAQSAGAAEILARALLSLGAVYFHQARIPEAKARLRTSVDIADKTGEVLTKGVALANIATIDKDPDSMEVALDLIEQSGHVEELRPYQAEYERMLKYDFEDATSHNDFSRAQMVLTRLIAFYKKQDEPNLVDKVEQGLQLLLQLSDLKSNKAMLLAMLEGDLSHNKQKPS